MSLIMRPMTDGDRGYVASTWVRSYERSQLAHKLGSWYRPMQNALVSRLLDTCPVLIACVASDPETILGWACTVTRGTVPVVHYVYVREECRGRGIAKQLLAPYLPVAFTVSHEPPRHDTNMRYIVDRTEALR